MSVFGSRSGSTHGRSSPPLVSIASVVIYAGIIVELFCFFSLAIWQLTGFITVNPGIAVTLLILCFCF